MGANQSDKNKNKLQLSEDFAKPLKRSNYDFIYLGQRIQEVRKSLGFSGESLAEQLNISAEYLRQIESGKTGKALSLSLFVSVCNTLQISPDYLLQDLLESNELTGILELDQLWENLPPSKQKLAVAMIKAAISYDDPRQ